MTVLGDTVYQSFHTYDSAGVLEDADPLPSGVLRRNGVDSAQVVTVTNNATGDYTASAVINAGWSNGDYVELVITAMVDGGTAKEVIWEDRIDVAVSAIQSTAVPYSEWAEHEAENDAALGTILTTATNIEADTQDIQTKIGTPAGASVSADIAAAKADTAAIKAKTDLLTSFDFVTAGTRFLTMIVQDGLVYQYTANALELGPTEAGDIEGLDNKVDQIIALFQQGVPDVPPGQQRGTYRIVQGDTYGPDHQRRPVTKEVNASWPDDLDDFDWTLHTTKHPDNENDGALAGTIEIMTPTGASRAVEFVFTAAQSQAAAIGQHLVAIKGTHKTIADFEWTILLGTVVVEDDYYVPA